MAPKSKLVEITLDKKREIFNEIKIEHHREYEHTI